MRVTGSTQAMIKTIMVVIICWLVIFYQQTAYAAVKLPAVKSASSVAPELKSLLLEDIFLGDRLKVRTIDNHFVAKLKNTFIAPKHAIYSNQAVNFAINKGSLDSTQYHDKIVLFNVGDTQQIGVVHKFTHKDVNVKDEVMINNYRIHVKDIQGVLLWNSSMYGETVHHTDALHAPSLMYVIEDIAAQELLGQRKADTNIYQLRHYKLNDEAIEESKPRLPDNTSISGMVIAHFSDGSRLIVGEHYRDLSNRDEWTAAKEGELLQVYLIK